MNVVTKLELEAEVKVILTGGAATSKVTFATLQTAKVDIGKKAEIRGSLLAPKAEVHFSRDIRFRGAVCARKISVDQNVKFQHHGSTAPFPRESENETFEMSESETVTDYVLEQNYPNPFNPSTVISFQLPVISDVSLVIYNLNGQQIRELASGRFESGKHSVVWDGRNESGLRVASGVYVYVLKAGGFVSKKKLVLMK